MVAVTVIIFSENSAERTFRQLIGCYTTTAVYIYNTYTATLQHISICWPWILAGIRGPAQPNKRRRRRGAATQLQLICSLQVRLIPLINWLLGSRRRRHRCADGSNQVCGCIALRGRYRVTLLSCMCVCIYMHCLYVRCVCVYICTYRCAVSQWPYRETLLARCAGRV